MGACAELLLYKGELDAIGDETPREVRLQELLKWQYLRSEITADSMSNRSDEQGFLDKLRDADPKGFGAFGKRSIEIRDNLLMGLRGAPRRNRMESRKVDQQVLDLEAAKNVALDTLDDYRWPLRERGLPVLEQISDRQSLVLSA